MHSLCYQAGNLLHKAEVVKLFEGLTAPLPSGEKNNFEEDLSIGAKLTDVTRDEQLLRYAATKIMLGGSTADEFIKFIQDPDRQQLSYSLIDSS